MARILLVDDDPNMRLIYATVLRHNGHDVVEATSASEALAAVEQGAFDLVILDVKLGTESGLTVLQRLATTSPHLPVILLTAYASFQDDFTSWLADRYLLKSSDLDVFSSEVEQVLQHRRMPPAHRQGVEERVRP
ncbi:MAG TPA: response regulator [Blastocatellia bacterium]|nr:response regulator [Blastocatellia bacterium]